MIRFMLLITTISVAGADYWTEREQFLSVEFSQAIGSGINLTEKELHINEILMGKKIKEFDNGFINPEDFFPTTHFFLSKENIEKSDVFKLIQKLPKGASLHSHDTALVSIEYLYNLTYRENLYGCVVNERLQFHFFQNQTNKFCDWKLISQLRQENATFDKFLVDQISIINPDPAKNYPNIKVVWAIFLDTFITTSGMLCYRPIFQEYFYQSLKELYEDNVMYLEFRGLLPEVYELNGTTYSPIEVVGLYVETLEQFKFDYPDFHGARFIYAPSRGVTNQTADDYVTTMKSLKLLYPDFVAGFDLVGEEDNGKPLRDFIPQLLQLSSAGIKFFFHAAETNWYGTSTDMNLVDAVLLNTTRIGHGYGVVKHPKVLQAIKEKGIALEISPISNQVLKLVDDLRNHPGSFLVAGGYPIVITCDDPSFWGAKALSYDWYMAFMAFGSKESDLRLLKQLAINSLIYSSMDVVERADALKEWEVQWDKFLDEILTTSNVKQPDNSYQVDLIK